MHLWLSVVRQETCTDSSSVNCINFPACNEIPCPFDSHFWFESANIKSNLIVKLWQLLRRNVGMQFCQDTESKDAVGILVKVQSHLLITSLRPKRVPLVCSLAREYLAKITRTLIGWAFYWTILNSYLGIHTYIHTD